MIMVTQESSAEIMKRRKKYGCRFVRLRLLGLKRLSWSWQCTWSDQDWVL